MVEGLNPQEAIARLEKFQQMFEVRCRRITICTAAMSGALCQPSICDRPCADGFVNLGFLTARTWQKQGFLATVR